MPKIGLNVNEVEILTSTSMKPSNVNNVGILIDSKLGPINEAIQVGSISEFELKFGKADPNKYSYYVLKGLFDNIGNNEVSVRVIRAVGSTTGVAAFTTVGTSGDTVKYSRGYYGKESPGTQGNTFKIEIVASGPGYILNVYETVGTVDLLVESVYDLRTDNFEGKINSDSRYIACDVTGNGTIAPLVKVALSGGVDPVPATVSERAAILGVFDNFSIQMVFDAENTDTTTAANLEAYAANRNTVTALWCTPYAATVENCATNYTTALQKDKSFLAAYFNWIKVASNITGVSDLWVPPIGHIFGTYYVRKRAERGNFAHVPPAGPSWAMRGVLDFQNKNISESDLNSLVRDAGVNVVQFMSGYGYIVRSSRTLSTSNKWYSIHRRTSQNYIIETCQRSLRLFEQEPNTPLVRAMLKTSVDNFLGIEYQHGMFATDGGYSNNVRVTCDETNNTPMDIANRILNLLIQVHYVEVAEVLNISIAARDGGFNVDEN